MKPSLAPGVLLDPAWTWQRQRTVKILRLQRQANLQHSALIQSYAPILRAPDLAGAALGALNVRDEYAQARSKALLQRQVAEQLQQEVRALPALTAPGLPAAPPPLSGYMMHFDAQLQRQREAHGKTYDTAAEVDLLRQSTLGLVQRYRALGTAGRPEHLQGALSLVERQSDREAMTQASVNVLRAFRPGDAIALQRLVDEQRQHEQQLEQARQARQNFIAQRQADLEAELAPAVQRQAEQEASQGNLAEQLQSLRGGGAPLPETVRRQLERRLPIAPEYLASVRVHTGSEAHAFTKSIGALAATSGSDIFFQGGKYDPNSQSGLELLGHEVTHVQQQLSGRVQGGGLDPDATLEQEARAAGARAVAGSSPKSVPPATPQAATPTLTPAQVQRLSELHVPSASPAPWHRDFTGTLAGKEVLLSLRRRDATLHGRYQYAGGKGWLTLEGRMKQDGGRKFVKLTERDEHGQITGTLQGEFKGERGETFLGTWTAAKTERQFDFRFDLHTVHAPPAPKTELNQTSQPPQPQPNQQPSPPPLPKPPVQWSKDFEGAIGGKYAIRMHLKREGDTYNGFYYYARSGPNQQIKLSGVVNPETVRAVLQADNELFLGAMHGSNGNVFEGTWRQDGRELPFQLSERKAALAPRPPGEDQGEQGLHKGPHQLSDAILAELKQHEGLGLQPYNDSAGFATIGYGHLLHKSGVTESDREHWKGFTPEQAQDLYLQDLEPRVIAVNKLLKIPISQNMFDALVSLSFNIGVPGLAGSDLLALLNSGNYQGAADQFLVWNKARNPRSGKLEVVRGLVLRRHKERDWFLKDWKGQ